LKHNGGEIIKKDCIICVEQNGWLWWNFCSRSWTKKLMGLTPIFWHHFLAPLFLGHITIINDIILWAYECEQEHVNMIRSLWVWAWENIVKYILATSWEYFPIEISNVA
jgi:hypothetical protein